MTKHDVTVLSRPEDCAEAGIEALPTRSLADFDESKYLPLLDELDITEEQKRDLLCILWNMMLTCMEIGVPAQSWGQIVARIIQASSVDSEAINS